MDLAIDLEAACTCCQNAAEGGNRNAQRRLGIAYEKGEVNLEIDLEVALMWLQKAAEGGDEEEEEEEEEEGEWE